uniref:Uncharacterized protein n=1 Tax=Avena sativa TaxID=4498 RepID=A0ACD5V5T4_AVESA
MGELSHIDTASCFLLEDKSLLEEKGLLSELQALQSPIGEEIFLNHEENFYEEIFKDEIEEKNVVSEDLKAPEPDSSSTSSEHCCPSEALFVQQAEEQEKSIKVQSLSVIDGGVGDGVEEKRVECDPVPVETKKCERLRSQSSMISQRIRQWEDATSGNLKRVTDEKNLVDNGLEKGALIKGVVKVIIELETESCNNKITVPAQEIASVGEQPEQEFIDLKDLLQSKTAKCASNEQTEEEELQEQNVQLDPELQEQNHKDAKPEEEEEEDCHDVEPLQELREHEYKDADEESETLGDDAREETPLKSTSIARRVHTRISSENLVGEESPHKEKEKEWKRTLACKLYEERIQLKLLRDPAVVGACSGGDDMDMLWEAYETGGGSSAAAGDTKRGGSKAKRGNKQEESVDEGESEEEEDGDDEGPVRQLCCLQALKFSTRKMNFGGGKPSLAKISKVLKRMTALSRVGSRRNMK